jgi:ubiquinone/menaquinone biosynthesis C-methylase UbiE
MNYQEKLGSLLTNKLLVKGNLLLLSKKSKHNNQEQTNAVFGEKWIVYDNTVKNPKYEKLAQKWYLALYGFDNEKQLAKFLRTKKVILDAGCGLGDKTAWFARLAPNSLVIGMDFSDAVDRAAQNHKKLKNLFFLKGDISNTHLKKASIDYVNCDQVIHHTENPPKTFAHLCSILKPGGEFACYVYAKKALPRELIDDYFREFSKKCTKEELWELAKGVTELGKRLSNLKVKFVAPDIPLLGIKGGEYDIQRFIYWNFLKCYWNQELGLGDSLDTNFDWYAPSNAFRYSENEFRKMIGDNNLRILYFHKEEACYSGRFKKKK